MNQQANQTFRPNTFSEFVGQDHIKAVLETALISAKTSGKPL